MVNCPACDQEYPDMDALKAHLQSALGAPDDPQNHADVYLLEGWDDDKTYETTDGWKN